jgi:glycosyltransferase involved in cell wall biosynthesis
VSEIAVVIPTHRRETRLRFALEALADQTLDRDRFEVVVVRAPGAEGPFATAPGGLKVRFETASRPGPGAQRNHGWRSCDAPLIAFTDDDCRPEQGWLETLLVGAGDGCVVQGRTDADPAERHLLSGLARTQEVEPPSPWFESCNIAYPRTLLERLGGFDDDFGYWGEDTDLGLRAIDAGASLRDARGAVVWHAVLARTLPRAIDDARRREGLPLLIARHPEQRTALYRRWFANRAHAALAAGAVGLALTRGRRPATRLAAGLTPFVAHNLDYNRGRGLGSPKGLTRFAAQMPVRLAIDLVEIGSALRGSVRHRALVI